MKNTAKWKVGQIVKLNAGGPDMTIDKVVPNSDNEFNRYYRCQWFAGKKLDSGIFPEESLIEVVEEKK
ncbi:MAG: YodC family protein [Sulfurovum sp.]|nr:YodC family protein [Sulfurovum sp.]